MNETIALQTLPCGGLMRVDYSSQDPGTWTLTRNALIQGNLLRPEVLYQGPPIASGTGLYVDIGEGSLPLDGATTYLYEISTNTGTASASGIPAASLQLDFFDYTMFVLRFIQAGVQNVTLPGDDAFQNKPKVINAMPLTGAPSLPTISVAEDLSGQAEQGIGHTVNSDYQANKFTINEIANRRYRIAVLCSSTEEREFYKTLVISLFKGMLTAIMGQLGMDVRYSWHSSSSQQVDTSPGFYYSEIGLQFDTDFQTTITTSYPVASGLGDLTVSGASL